MEAGGASITVLQDKSKNVLRELQIKCFGNSKGKVIDHFGLRGRFGI